MTPLFDISTHPETRINTSSPSFFHFLVRLALDDSIKITQSPIVMKTTLLTEKEDMQWLGGTHLSQASPRPQGFDARGYAAAQIEGNEDCPQSILLWKKEPKWNTPPTLEYKLQEDGSYKLTGGTCNFAKAHKSR